MSNPAPAIDRTLRFGTHVFVNSEDTPAELFPRLRVLAGSGFTLIRLFLPWQHLEPAPGSFRWSPYDEIFDEAGRLGMKVVPTLMAVSPPGWMGLTHGLQEVADLDDPAFFTLALAHASLVVARYRDHPALDSWILWNEPCRRPSPASPHTLRAYREYLKDEYGDIASCNRSAHRPAASFDEIQPPPADLAGFVSHRGRVDWLLFAVADLRRHIGRLAARVRSLDPAHPVHVNPHRVGHCVAEDGQSLWGEADLVDFVGCSAHPPWHSTRFPRERYGDSVAYFADLARSATRDARAHFWVTELQGGTTLMSAGHPLHPSPAETRQWLWQGVASGARAVVYWCANARGDGYEAGEWDLLDYRGEATPQLRAIADTLRRLSPHLPVLARARPPAPDLGILVSEPAGLLDLVDGSGETPDNPRNRQKTSDALAGAYLLAADLSLEPRLFDFARFLETAPAELPPVIVVPGAVVLEPAVLAHLSAAVDAGRLVVGDGLFAWKDAGGRLARELWPAADRLWGAACVHYGALPSDQSYQPESGPRLTGWFFRASLQPGSDARVLARWDDDDSAAVTWRSAPAGAGAACRVGTLFFQRYFTAPSAGARAWFSSLVRDRVSAAVPRLLEPGPGLRLRRLDLAPGCVSILVNRHPAERSARVRLPDGSIRAFAVPGHDAVVLPPA